LAPSRLIFQNKDYVFPMTDHDKSKDAIARLLEIMAQLRNPDGGCPWDLEQNFATIAPYTIEEAYEVADAIQREDMHDLQDELGDLLLQVVFHSQMASEETLFDFSDVVSCVNEKMIRRHPHIFGEKEIVDAEAQTLSWENIKAEERQKKAETLESVPSVLDGIPTALPALLRALKLSRRAARVGFDWENLAGVFEKLQEEIDEVKQELRGDSADKISSTQKEKLEEEIGDLLFVVANLARKCDIDPENALRRANYKFETRFKYIEHSLAKDNTPLENTSLETMEALWQEAKNKG